jgi:hypothetical protein
VVGNIIIDIKRARSMQMDLGSTVSSIRTPEAVCKADEALRPASV